MTLRDRIPEQLTITDDSLIAATMETDVGVFPTSDYILLEISHKAGRIDVYKVANTAYDLVKNGNRMVAIRGYGFKGIGLSVRIAHEIRKMEKRFQYQMTFDTFDAYEPDTERPQTSVQIVVMPPEDESEE
ncbi:MAG: hypothetical protein BAJATHORv1_70012 [Candidatus Thorarchaeota archaeon]|nr:MAG: hypothetical protein BAJATHORv1_70012 [Candidatus Thorarchaeota archaeon]